MASAMNQSVGRLRFAISAVTTPRIATTSYASTRSLSASVRRWDDDKARLPTASDEPSSSASTSNDSDASNHSGQSTSYQPPSRASQGWPFDSTSPSSSSDASSSASTSSESNPYKGLFDGSDPFPTVTVPKLGASSSSLEPSAASDKASWLSDQLDSLTTSPRTPRPGGRSMPSEDGRKKHSIPRSVLFADSETARQSDDFRPRKPPANVRKRFDRTPLTQQEANAFMSLLNQALAATSSSSTSSSSSSTASDEQSQHATPFGSYTSLISNPKTQSGSRALLQAFAKRNKLKRFEEARAQRAKRFVREGLAAQIDPLQLEAGIDEAREQIAMCGNLAELLEWTKKQVWGIGGCATHRAVQPEKLADMLSETTLGGTTTNNDDEAGDADTTAKGKVVGPRYGKDTPYYASVLQLVFVTIRDRYRSPRVALSVARTTRWLGLESYVLGVTGSLYNEVLKTQWDWLGDLPGVVSTLRQARETGILSAPVKHSATAPPKGTGLRSSYATTEDDMIRETVDRIANDVRKYVLDQQMANDDLFKRKYLYGVSPPPQQHEHEHEHEDVLSARQRTPSATEARDWSQSWRLANADEATLLAGQPFRLTHPSRSRFTHSDDGRDGERSDGGRSDRSGGAGAGRFSGAGAHRKTPQRPFNARGGDDGGGGRFPSSFGSRSSRSRDFDRM